MEPTPPRYLPPKQIDALTSVRGVFALWIVIYHFWNDLLCLFPVCDFLSPIARSGHLAVPGFFILSGFVLSYNYSNSFFELSWKKYFNFLTLRLARIYPVHIFTLLIVLAMVLVSKLKGYELDWNGYTTVQFVENVFLVQTWDPDFVLNWNYPSWSISSEWFAYLFFPLLLQSVKTLGKRKPTSVFQAVFFLILSSAWIINRYSFAFPDLLIVLPTFVSGICLYQVHQFMDKAARKGLILVKYTWPFACISMLFFEYNISATIFIFYTSILILSLSSDSPTCSFWDNQFLINLGESSYSLYMTHTLAQKILYRILPCQNYIEGSIQSRIIISFFYLSLIALFSISTYYLIEKPCRKLMRSKLKGIN